MNPVSIKDVGTAPSRICHLTGLPITSRPDWTDILLDKDTDYKATLSILGDSILTSHASGYATLNGLKKGLEIADEVVISVMGEDHPYVRIEEFSNLHGTTLEARRYYIDHLRGSEQLLGLIFCGVSSMFNLSIKLAKRLNIVKFEVQIVNDYSEAVKLALKMLSIDGICEDDPIIDPKDTLSANIYTRPDWSVQLNDFSARFEIIDGDILHAATSGFLEEEHVAQIFQTHEKVMNAVALPKGSYYFVGGVEEVAGSRKARKLYYDYIVQWYEDHPFQKYIFYGANRFLRAAINLTSPFALCWLLNSSTRFHG